MKMSIIIPFYNVEQYIEKCILSCLHQNIPENDYEIILINDGSSDGSGLIAEEMAKTSSSIRYLTQENRGLSCSRNRGLSCANGNVIWFVDSDDWIEENCLADLLDTMGDADAMVCTRMFPEGLWHGAPYYIPDSVKDKEGWFLSKSPSPAQFYLFKRSFLLDNKLLFAEGRKHEDSLFTPCAICKASSLKFYRVPVYHFNKRPGSITTTIDKKRIFDHKFILSELMEFYLKQCPRNLKKGFANRISNSVVAHMDISRRYGKEMMEDTYMFLKENPDLVETLKYSIKKNTKIMYYINKALPLSLMTIYVLLSKIRYRNQ